MSTPTPPLEIAVPEPLTRGHKKRERTRRGLVDAALRLVA
ncbi:TetR/AcrR family transcriptional regulator, partial [Pseudomonas sp. MWU12-2312b]